MTDIILEVTRTLVLAGILIFLWKAGKDRFEATRRGWHFILTGFALLFVGSFADITDNFESLNRFIIIGDTEAQAFIEKFVGFLGGFIFLAIGLLLWIPSVQRLTDEIADRKKAEGELTEIKDELEIALRKEKDLNQLQREFVSMTSHEFRTPLAIIDGCALRLHRRADSLRPAELVEKVDSIRTEVQNLTRLMETMLDSSRFEEGKIDIELKECNIANFVRLVCENHQAISNDRTIRLEHSDLPESIQTDGGALEQVLNNLILNAVKYSSEATDIEVLVSQSYGSLIISVRDYGIGIDQDDLVRIGERYFRAKTSVGIPGTGIGINLSRKLLEMLGGTLQVESVVGEGSTFTIHLPIVNSEQIGLAQEKAA